MLKGKTAFITGGSGALGAAIVRVFCRENCRVAFSYKNHPERARELETELRGLGGELRAYPLDVLDAKACVETAAKIEQELGPVDVLVNNAGSTQILPFAMIEEKDWDHAMDVNVKGTFLVTKAFARGMIRRKSGSIVNIGSLAGMRMLEVPVHYATAKSAMVGFTLSLAREFGRYCIRVNAVAPGMLDGGVSVNVPAKQRDEYMRYCASSRMGQPAEVAELVAFLASDRATYLNAQTILIDGGI
ncbi:MAG: SDR family oxidoreductase [Phycisphaerales bacterium]|nr:SDR family oxidoreductase [Phycisphaerales bacterium]